VQHHFSSKSQLLEGVLQDSFQTMAFDLNNVPIQGKSLQERVELFVDECWEHCNSPAFQASLQILRGMRNQAPQELDKWLQVSLSSTVAQGRAFWLKMFSEIRLPEAEHQELLSFVFSSLNGVVSFSRINQQPGRVDSDLRHLKALLLLRFQNALQA
jgi:AcrR family transcriptional regulator